jgi:hypothetical protein
MTTKVMGKPFDVKFKGKLKSSVSQSTLIRVQMQSEYFIIPPEIAIESLEAAGYKVDQLIHIKRGGQTYYEC